VKCKLVFCLWTLYFKAEGVYYQFFYIKTINIYSLYPICFYVCPKPNYVISDKIYIEKYQQQRDQISIILDLTKLFSAIDVNYLL